MKKMLVVLMLFLGFFTFSQAADAATIISQSGGIFSSPQVAQNKVKINMNTSAVKYVRHTKYNDSSWTDPAAYKQLKATSNYTGFAYSCPGYYMTRVYSDSNGTNMIGFIRVYVSDTDIKNASCDRVEPEDRTPPRHQINVTHPSDTVKEPTKMVDSTAKPSPSAPIVKNQVDEDDVQYLNGQVDPATLSADQACKQQAASTGVDWSLRYNSNTSTWQCVVVSDCMYDSSQWYCSAEKFDPNKYKPTTIDNPERNLYVVSACSDAAADDCMSMYMMGPGSAPNNSLVTNEYSAIPTTNPGGGEEQPPTEPEPPGEDSGLGGGYEGPSGECPVGSANGVVYDDCRVYVDSCGTDCDPTPSDKTCNAGVGDDRDPYSWQERTEDYQCARFFVCWGDSPYKTNEQYCADTLSGGGDAGTTEPTEPTGPNCEQDIWAEECLPSCYCPDLGKYGQELGFMCCIFECPGWSDFMGFITDTVTSAIGDISTPEVEPLPGPVQPENPITPTVDKKQLPPPTGQEDPGLGDASFDANDLKSGEEIPVREDPTGGFDIVNPMDQLEGTAKEAPKPKLEDLQRPQPNTPKPGTGQEDQAKWPTYGGGSATQPSAPGTAQQPSTGGEAKQPDMDKEMELPTLNR